MECSDCQSPITAQSKSGKCRVCSQRKGPPFQRLLSKIKRSAENKDIPFDLTLEDLELFTNINHCHYCGDDIEWIKYGKGVRRTNLDRIEPDKGYTKDNLVVACWSCNEARGARFTYSEFCKLKDGLKEIKKLRDKKKERGW